MKYCLIIDGELFACCHSEPVPVAMVNHCLLYTVKCCLIADGELFAGCHGESLFVNVIHSEVLPYCCW